MIESLSIKNLALIKNQQIEFNLGLNVLLGETGSGKSLIFDAISFVTGAKTDKTLLRTGEKSMKVDAIFSNLSPMTKSILEDYEIEGEEILLTRVLQEDGRSSFKINGEPATAGMVKNLAKTLLDGLVQHESMQLLKSKNHLLMLDKFGGDEIASIKALLLKNYLEKKDIEKQIASLGGSEAEREREKDLLSFQIKEIEKAELELGEDDEIKEKLDLMSSAERIYEVTTLSEKLLSEDQTSAINLINEVISSLSSLSKFDAINECCDRLSSLRYDLEDIAEVLAGLRDATSYDKIEFNRLDARMDQIKSLKKKYGASIEEILSYQEKLQERLNEIEDSEDILQKLSKKLEEKSLALLNTAETLSSKRKDLAKNIEASVIKELADLGMKNTSFKVNFTEKNISEDGMDDVEFIFSANKGQDMKTLSKTASGGEASRVMLALKNIFASIDGVGTMLFDEVDSGISGEVGNMVAEKLLSISKSAQVLCITHLPQVAALADNFLLVEKQSTDSETISMISQIDEERGITEIARLIGGNNISETARKHALEMRNRKK